MDSRLQQQVNFFLEADKLKSVVRQNYLADGSRKENAAEHCWHLALMCLLFREHAQNGEVPDLLRVLKMCLLHDLVEIDAGDTYCYDETAGAGKVEREQQAAERLFGLLPADQEVEFRSLWHEFEEKRTPEALFAAALDRLQPLTLNYITAGKSWKEHAVTLEQVVSRNSHIAAGAPALWEFAAALIDDAANKGYLLNSRDVEKNRLDF